MYMEVRRSCRLPAETSPAGARYIGPKSAGLEQNAAPVLPTRNYEWRRIRYFFLGPEVT